MMKNIVKLIVVGSMILGACTPVSGQRITQVGGTDPWSTQLPAATPAPTATATATPTLAPTYTPSPTLTATPAPIRFAVIGDYGSGDEDEGNVANLVKSWNPDFVITVGDNNYPDGEAETMDAHVGKHYHEFIFPYLGTYGPGAATNRFFPTIGNHDLNTNGGQAYFNYFTLPGNERYYDFTVGPVHFFAVNSDSREPDGVGQSSVQAQWLQQVMAGSTTPWQIVYFHHAPYSSGTHGSVDWMCWPFAEWGADAILSGHDHTYERLTVDGIPYFVNGVGGGGIYSFENVLPESQLRFNDEYGAMLVTASPQRVLFQFFTIDGQLVDTLSLQK